MENLFKNKNTINLIVLNLATILVMILSSSYAEFLSLNSFLLPIPFAIMYSLVDRKTALISAVINIIFTIVISRNLTLTVLNCFMILILGIIIGKSVKEKRGIGIALLEIFSCTIILSLAAIIIYVTIFEKISLADLFASIREFVNEYLNTISNTEGFNGIIISADEILINVPIIFIVYYMINSIFNYFITFKIVAILKKERAYLKPFYEYYVSNILGAVLIVIYCFGIILDRSGFAIGNYLTNSFYFMLTLLLKVNGLAFIYNFLINKFKYNKTISIIILLASFFMLSDVVILIGFIEMIMDYRKLDPHRIFKRK